MRRSIFCIWLILAMAVNVDAQNNAGGNFTIWPDTGQTLCYDDQGNVITCPGEGQPFHGQDAQYQGPSRSYTSQGGGTMVQDNITGLIWEVKNSMDGVQNLSNPHDADNIYVWCDTNPDTNGGYEGTCIANDDTEDFINTLNGSNFGGFSDWRLPSLKELSTLVNFSNLSPAINTTVFPNTVSNNYWSSTTYADSNHHAWFVDFSYGGIAVLIKFNRFNVRAVRGGNNL